jgi:chromosome segregation protein
MRLKSLDLVGFKSFFEPTAISFSPGITAVVGPNGCGKSNVVDAIRWVLGEQAPTRLRGKASEDLIYAGNESNPPAGMAEVTLLLEAEESSNLPEPYTALSEVAVTRRVYRSGDSEYLINKIPCRLKDITEFFMAAQIHSRGYALIEQGRIEEIIQAKPAELRAMVEEAAGLSLFKGRREISERKLERVKENLARVDDVLSEIERQLNFARRQAKKAEAYKLIRSELSELEKLSAARRLVEQHSELIEQSTRELELREKAEAARASLALLQAEAEGAGAALQAERDELAGTGRELENLRTAAEQRARTCSFLERRLESIDELEPGIERQLSELDDKATSSRAARAEAGARLARESSADGGASEAAFDALRERYTGAEHALKNYEERLEELKDLLSEIVREGAVIRGRLADLTGERAELEERLCVATAELPEITASLGQSQQELAAAACALDNARAEAQHIEARQRDCAEGEVEARTALEHHAVRVGTARDTLAATSAYAERVLLPNGAGERLRTVLESFNGDRPASDPRLLLDVVRVPAALESALRAVLGEQLEAVIVDSPHFAIRAIEVLKGSRSGRLSFIPDSVAAGAAHTPVEAPGILGRLLDMIEIEPGYVQLAEALLGHVMVAEDLSVALAASNLNGYGTAFVTREGDLLWPDRFISGGSGDRGGDSAHHDFQNGRPSVEAARLALAQAEAEHEALALRFEEERAAHRRVNEELEAARGRAAEAERAAAAARMAVARGEQRLALAEAERANAERRIGELSTLVTSSNVRLQELARSEQDARARITEAVGNVEERKTAVRDLGAQMLDMGSRVEARKAALGALELEHRHLSQFTAELEAQFEQHRAQLQRARSERIEFNRELESLVAQDEAASARHGELETTVQQLQARCVEREGEVNAARARLAQARETLSSLEGEAVDRGFKRERARTLIEELERGFLEKFQAEFASVRGELESALAGRDGVRDEERLAGLRAKAERIGEVNLAAESEVKELEERSSALNAERADLKAAVDDLTHTIHKLNREARKRFAETFEGAARNFAELFPKLLRGGKGRLELTEASDVLEAGVNILVQPAGKKVKEIGLLSGGEKALCAMALIFSLFLLNPSPFCVMDEVDAPLDEFSLAAFTSLVSELKQRSQFIIITHNQRTMQRADNIHGVTMERPGISRIVSLKIPQAA